MTIDTIKYGCIAIILVCAATVQAKETTTTTTTITEKDGTTTTSTTTTSTTTESPDWLQYLPKVNGIFRGQFQQSTSQGESRFRVRNARVRLNGYVMPMVDYTVQVDLCDKGQMKILDAYIRLRPADGLSIMMGQERVPFSVESSRTPAEYHFTDISLVGKFGNLRSAGIKAGYTIPHSRIYIEGGVFNSSDMTNHAVWHHSLTYGIKANCKTPIGLRPELAFMSRVPGTTGMRINQYNGSLSWGNGNWFIEGEYILRCYTQGEHSTSHAYNFYIDYGWPVNWKWAQRMSVQARFDGMSEAVSGLFIDDDHSDDLMPARKRITLGTTARHTVGRANIDFRLNYEKFFYSSSVKDIDPNDDDKLVASMIVYF